MITIALISPGKPRGTVAAAAADIYTNRLTIARLNYARKVLRIRDEHIFFVSVYHGLLPINRIIQPVERDIRSLEQPERARWATGIKGAVRQSFHTLSKIVFMGGSLSRDPLVDMLKPLPGVEVVEPITGEQSGAQIEWYARQLGYLPKLDGNGL